MMKTHRRQIIYYYSINVWKILIFIPVAIFGDMTISITRVTQVTFHRAFDLCRDAISAFQCLLELRVDRLLTSGQCSTALSGIG